MRGVNELFAVVFDEQGTYADKPPSDAYLLSRLADETFVCVAAFDDERVVGALAGFVLRKFEQERSEIYVYDLAVAETHRRRGIATALIEDVRRIARECGSWVVFIQADEGDEPPIRLYSKLGTREDAVHFDIDPHD